MEDLTGGITNVSSFDETAFGGRCSFRPPDKKMEPKMAPYIFTERNNIHIIDLQKSVGKVDEAYKAIFEIAEQGGTVLFVGTKKQAQDASQR